jgi:hypothetical protein
MKSKILFKERGQALVLVALAAVVLFGFVALAIDGSAKFSDRRHAQNAADTAALAGALALVNNDSNWKLDALGRAYDNGYTGDLVKDQVWVFKCSDALADRDDAPLDCGPYEGNSNYIAVIILSHVDTTFAKVIGFNQTHNLVSSVTYWNKRGPLYDGNLIVALNPNPCTGNGANGNIALGTSGGSHSDAEIRLTGGGAFVNSNGTGCGMEVMGCPTITIDNGNLSSVGDGNVNLDVGSQACSDKITAPGPSYNQDPYPFPPKMKDVPDICSTSQPSAPVNNSTLRPGYYSSFPPNGGSYRNLRNDITLQAGIYCLDTDLSLSNGKSITGSNVLIYLKSGHVFSIQGGTLKLSGRTEGDYKGYVLIVDSNFTGQTPNCIVNGAADATFTGTIFAPYCDVEIDGGGKTTSLTAQIIGYTVKITGSQTVNLTYKESDSAKNEPQVGFMR